MSVAAEAISATVGETLQRAQVRLAILFGSAARGNAGPDSDIDIAVLGDMDSLTLGATLSLSLGREVDVIRLETATIPLLVELIRDGVCIYQAVPGTYASWRCRVLCDLEIDLPWYRRMSAAFLARVAAKGLHGSS